MVKNLLNLKRKTDHLILFLENVARVSLNYFDRFLELVLRLFQVIEGSLELREVCLELKVFLKLMTNLLELYFRLLKLLVRMQIE